MLDKYLLMGVVFLVLLAFWCFLVVMAVPVELREQSDQYFAVGLLGVWCTGNFYMFGTDCLISVFCCDYDYFSASREWTDGDYKFISYMRRFEIGALFRHCAVFLTNH